MPTIDRQLVELGARDEAPHPLLLVAELSYTCPLRCPYCSNPTDIAADRHRAELETEHWQRVMQEAADLGVLQLALTGGEPMVRRDLEQIVAASTAAGLYSTLVTSAIPFPRERAEALKAAGLDHVQISLQDADRENSDHIAGLRSFDRKMEAAAIVRELGWPLTINTVLHRHNLDNVREIIRLAEQLGARRLELANTQYHGWATLNRGALMPTRDQVERAEVVVNEERDRIGSAMEILWVLPDHFEELPKPCMGGWGRDAMIITPAGSVLPCQSAATIPDMEFANVREDSLRDIWFGSSAFNAFRGTDWMQDPCRTCPLQRQHVDFGGCRCQALALTGDAAATDPVCHLSPKHALVAEVRDAALEPAADHPFIYRTTKTPPPSTPAR